MNSIVLYCLKQGSVAFWEACKKEKCRASKGCAFSQFSKIAKTSDLFSLQPLRLTSDILSPKLCENLEAQFLHQEAAVSLVKKTPIRTPVSALFVAAEKQQPRQPVVKEPQSKEAAGFDKGSLSGQAIVRELNKT